jgi:hypothetical protein
MKRLLEMVWNAVGPLILGAVVVAVILVATMALAMIFSGCRGIRGNQQGSPAIHRAQQSAEEGEEEAGEKVIACFPSGVEAVVHAAQSASISDVTANALSRLHLPGFALIGFALAARLIFGNWKDAALAGVLGLVPSIGAILLTDFPATALLVPLCGVVLLIVYVLKKFAEWHTGYKAWRDVSSAIEATDSGPRSTGGDVKGIFERLGLKPHLNDAVKMMEREWDDLGIAAGKKESGKKKQGKAPRKALRKA